MLSRIAFALCLSIFVLAPNSALADQLNVLDFGAIPNDSDDNDDAFAFRAAVTAAAARGGSTIYVPAGKYHFNSIDSTTRAHVRLHHRGIRFLGDQTSDPTKGSVIESKLSDAPVFAIVKASGTPNGIGFENLTITRSSPSPLTEFASGIRIFTYDGGVSFLTNIDIRDCRIINQYDGVRSPGTTSEYGRPFTFNIDGCEISNNLACGINLDHFGELRISNTSISSNGSHGVRIQGIINFFGTAHFTGCGIGFNGGSGILVIGDSSGSSGVRAQDIMIGSCQLDRNDQSAITLDNAKHVQIVGCLLSANGPISGQESILLPALDIIESSHIAVSGCSILSNQAEAISVRDSLAVTIGSLQISQNNRRQVTSSTSSFPAILITDSTRVTLSGIGFFGDGIDTNNTQDYGIVLIGDTDGILGAGLNFGPTMASYFDASLVNPGSQYRFEYYNGTELVVVED